MRPAIRFASPLLLFVLLASLAAGAQVTGSFDRTLAVTGPVDLTVQTGSGTISVRTGEAASVRVVAQIRATGLGGWFSGNERDLEERVRRIEQNPPIQQDGNTIRIGPLDRDLGRGIAVSYDITVPVDTRLKTSSGSGWHSIAGVRGPVDASSGSGKIEVFNVARDVRASTGSGPIELDRVQGEARARTGSGGIRASRLQAGLHGRTGSGAIRIEHAQGRLDLSTGSGGVEVQDLRGALRARTGSGGIRAQGAPAEAWDLQAGSGSIRLSLPQDAGFRLDARTNSGRVSVDHPIDIEHQDRRRELRGAVRGGGPTITARTGSGSVSVN